MGLAERADVIVDFTNVPPGNYVLGNVGPDEPFGGGVPGRRLRRRPTRTPPARSCSSRRARRWLPTRPRRRSSCSCRPITPLPAETVTRPLALLEEMSMYFDGRAGRGAAGHRRRRSATRRARRLDQAHVDGPGHREPGRRAPPRSGRSTTPPPTPTRCTSTRWCSRWSTARTSSSTRRRRTVQVAPGLGAVAARALGDRLQGHRHRLPGPGDPGAGAVQQRRASTSGTATSSSTRTTR